MLTFLRKIRKSLIDSGNARKYLLYAIGEIALVVIGILIALSINNWNEGNKMEVLEIEMLNDFKASLEADLINFNRASEMGEKAKSSMEIILAHLEADLPYSDSLKFHFGLTAIGWMGQVNGSVFKSLESEGLALISNKDLRQELVRFYDNLVIGKISRNNRYFEDMV